MLTINNLTKKYKKNIALKNANLQFEEGHIYGIVGLNGAGKTTLFKMIAGIVRPTEGEIIVKNDEPIQHFRQKIGFMIENPYLYENMTALQNMKIIGGIKGEYNVELTDADNTKILKAAEDFMAANSKEAIEKTSATTEIIEEVLRLFTVRAKVYDAIVAKADTNVSDEEAAQRTFSYLRFNLTGKTDESGNTVEYTDDEKNNIREDAKAYLERAKAGETLDDLAKEADTMVLKYSYGSDESENGTMDKTVIEAADKLNEGELSEVIESEDVVYIIRLDSTFDAEATASKKEEIINTRKSDLYNETIEGWKADSNFEIKQDVWKKVDFKTPLNITTAKTEESSTEQ